jgi:hypothetical protein
MAQIAVDFLLGPDWMSRLISYYGQGPGGYSHAASVLADGRYLDARNDVIAGVPAGVHIRFPSTEKWIKKRRASLRVTQAEYDAWEANLRAKITDEYARGDILSFIFNRDLHVNGTYDCSELALNAVQHIKKVPFPLVIPAHLITPNVCLLLLQVAGFSIGPIMTPD